jgi:bifunctional UDP-N-acetylglucosamine pyrophosphorylase/glucosamine-1-phosphate N-acetyltransferase
MRMKLDIVILAAGQGTRMYSDKPKVLHELAGKPLLTHVYHGARTLNPDSIYIVYGYGGDEVCESLPALDVEWVEQAEQLGTGHAVQQVIPNIDDDNLVLVLYGDVPLITNDTLKALVETGRSSGFSLLTAFLEEPRGYGRIIRDENGRMLRIVEEKDASPEEKAINEINTGFMVVKASLLKPWLKKLGNDNAQKEYYLTDIIEIAVSEGSEIETLQPGSEIEIYGVNDRAQLSQMERYYQLIQSHELMRQGVTIFDPARFDLRGDLEVGQDVEIDINVLLEGRNRIGKNVRIGPNCIIKDTVIGNDVEIKANCVIENAVIGNACQIGPFSRIRPDAVLEDHVHVGNFVELKKSTIGHGTKINHLSYVGDSEVGMNVNIGAGTITCNYDGANKHKTIIGDNVFIGSDTQLVAPVTVKNGATIAAGTTVCRDVEEDALAISRTEQKVVKKWKRPGKTKH